MFKSMFNGFSGSPLDSRSYSLRIILPNLLLNKFILVLTMASLGLPSRSGRICAPQTTRAVMSIILAVFSTILFAPSKATWHFTAASSDACLVNAFSPPHFSTDQIADSHANSLSPVRIEPLAHKLIQSLDIRFRKIQSD